MHNYSLRQFGRTILTIAGILLLVIFGSRAASQATSLSAVGGQPNHSLYPIALTASQLVSIARTSSQHSAAQSYEVAVAEGDTSENQVASQPSEDTEKVAKAAGKLKQTAAQLADEAKSKISDTTQTAKQDEDSSRQDLLQLGVK